MTAGLWFTAAVVVDSVPVSTCAASLQPELVALPDEHQEFTEAHTTRAPAETCFMGRYAV